MTASVTYGRALRYAEGSARGLIHHVLGHCPWLFAVHRIPLRRRPVANREQQDQQRLPMFKSRIISDWFV
jgi:hypothetical protein